MVIEATSQKTARLRLADVVSALSMAVNMQMGFHIEHATRVAYIGMKLADGLKLSDEDRLAVYYGAFIKDAG
jgi:HD-GYP domain-containing protein (c-di-GMP phosphodiesterase class II)